MDKVLWLTLEDDADPRYVLSEKPGVLQRGGVFSPYLEGAFRGSSVIDVYRKEWEEKIGIILKPGYQCQVRIRIEEL